MYFLSVSRFKTGPHSFANCYAIWSTKTRRFSTGNEEKRCQKHIEFVVPFYQVFLLLTRILVLPNRTKTNDNAVIQMKHQLDATLCRFYFCRVTLHVSGVSAHHQEYLKLVQRPLVHVFCMLQNTRTSGRCTSFKYS